MARLLRSATVRRGSMFRSTTLALAVTIGAGSVVLAPSTARADVQITEEAKARFAAGVNLLKDPEGARYEEAYREFTAAYAASPVYKILGNLGLCAMKLERDAEAIAAYEKYLADGKGQIEEATVRQVETDLQTLKAGIVWITVSANQPFTIVDVRVPVRGDRVTNAYGPFDKSTRIGIHSGTHIVTARSRGFPDITWEFDTTGQKEMPAHNFEFKETAAATVAPVDSSPKTVRFTERPVPTPVWIGAAATGVFAVGTAITGVLAMSKHSDFESKNDGRTAAEAKDLKDSGQTLNLVTDVMLGATVVAAGVTAVLYLTRPAVEVERPIAGASRTRLPTTATLPLRATPTTFGKDGLHGAGVMLSGGLPWQM